MSDKISLVSSNIVGPVVLWMVFSSCLLAEEPRVANDLYPRTPAPQLFDAPPVKPAVRPRMIFFPKPKQSALPSPVARRPAAQVAVKVPNVPPAIIPVSATLEANQNIVDEVARRAGKVVLVDFYADWCGPCKKQGEILRSIEPVVARNGVSIVKVDVDTHEALAAQLGVNSLPTLVVIKDGKIVQRKSGLADAKEIATMVGM